MADSSGLRASVLLDAQQKTQVALDQLLQMTQNETPVGLTGALRDTETTTGPDLSGELITASIEAPMPYAGFVDGGTRAYTIKPRKGKVLVFESGGETVFARSVNHPGITARNFFSQPMAERWSRVLQAVFG